MSDLSQILVNQKNYVSLNAQGLQAGTVYMPNILQNGTGATSSAQPVTLGMLPQGNNEYQLYISPSSYFNVAGGLSQSLNVGNNTVLFSGQNDLIGINYTSFTNGILTLPISGVYKLNYNVCYNPVGTNANNTLNCAVVYNSVNYAENFILNTQNAPMVLNGSTILRINANSTIFINVNTSRTGGSETINGCNFSIQKISDY